MERRVDYHAVAPEGISAMRSLGIYLAQADLDPALVELVKVRASQINGCAYCLNTHSKDARKHGVTEQQLYLLNAWRESPCYSDRERAALAWTEAVTLLSDGHVPDDVYELARQQFSERDLVDLTMTIISINGWNRLAVSFRTPPGD